MKAASLYEELVLQDRETMDECFNWARLERRVMVNGIPEDVYKKIDQDMASIVYPGKTPEG